MEIEERQKSKKYIGFWLDNMCQSPETEKIKKLFWGWDRQGIEDSVSDK